MTNEQLLLSNQICFPVYSTSRLITKAYKPFLSRLEITYPQYLVFMVLWENDGITINQISEKFMLNTNTLSPLLKRMEKAEFILRNRSKEDERSVMIQLTEKGKELKNRALSIPEQLLETLLSENIKLDDVIQLKNTLNSLIEVLTKNSKNEK